MGLLNGLTKQQELSKIQEVAQLTIVGYFARQLQDSAPGSYINNTGSTSITELTMGQLINFLFANEIDVFSSRASDAVKHEFEAVVQPRIMHIAQNAISADDDLYALTFNNLNEWAALLQNEYGNEWASTPLGGRISYVLDVVFGRSPEKPLSLLKYRLLVFNLHAKYEKQQSDVDWRSILTI